MADESLPFSFLALHSLLNACQNLSVVKVAVVTHPVITDTDPRVDFGHIAADHFRQHEGFTLAVLTAAPVHRVHQPQRIMEGVNVDFDGRGQI